MLLPRTSFTKFGRGTSKVNKSLLRDQAETFWFMPNEQADFETESIGLLLLQSGKAYDKLDIYKTIYCF